MNVCSYLCIVVQICHWFEGYFPVLLGMVVHDHEIETMENNFLKG